MVNDWVKLCVCRLTEGMINGSLMVFIPFSLHFVIPKAILA